MQTLNPSDRAALNLRPCPFPYSVGIVAGHYEIFSHTCRWMFSLSTNDQLHFVCAYMGMSKNVQQTVKRLKEKILAPRPHRVAFLCCSARRLHGTTIWHHKVVPYCGAYARRSCSQVEELFVSQFHTSIYIYIYLHTIGICLGGRAEINVCLPFSVSPERVNS